MGSRIDIFTIKFLHDTFIEDRDLMDVYGPFDAYLQSLRFLWSGKYYSENAYNKRL